MTPHNPTVDALADTFDADTIRAMRKVALKVKMEGGTITRNYEGSSFTISRENCEQVISDCNAALVALNSAESGDDPTLTRAPQGIGIDFRHRCVE